MYIDMSLAYIFQDIFFNAFILLWLKRLIDIAPVNCISSSTIFYDESVLWRSSGELTGVDTKCSIIRQHPHVFFNRFLDELCRCQHIMDLFRIQGKMLQENRKL